MIFFIAEIQGGIGPIFSIYLRSNLGWDTRQVGMALATTGIVGALFQIPSGIIVVFLALLGLQNSSVIKLVWK